MKCGVAELEKIVEVSRREGNDWGVTEVGSENWGQRRGNWKGKARGVGRLGVGRLERGENEFRGEGRGGFRPSLRSHSSPSSNFTCQMSSASVDTSWSVTTPWYHRLPNFIRTCRPTRW